MPGARSVPPALALAALPGVSPAERQGHAVAQALPRATEFMSNGIGPGPVSLFEFLARTDLCKR